jgi:hypothetical protein
MRTFAIAAMTIAVFAAPAQTEELPRAEVKAAMLRVERTLSAMGIEVAGYAAGDAPVSELAAPDHPYLQGNDGGYVDGRVYISTDAIEDCRELTLIHELVHDATVRRRLFATAPDARVKDLLEALADAVVAASAEEPYRPGCLPRRTFETATAELVQLANAAP